MYLPPQSNLRRHYFLPLNDERARGAPAVLPPAQTFVSLQVGHDSVVATARALRSSETALALRYYMYVTSCSCLFVAVVVLNIHDYIIIHLVM